MSEPATQTEAPLKRLRDMLELEIRQAEEELDRPTHGLFVSGVLAGIGVGTSTLAMAMVLTLAGTSLPEPVVTLLAANAYTIGFIVVILAHSDLFTEYTTVAILPVLTGHAGVRRLARLWALVYAGNLVGAIVAAVAIAALATRLDIIDVAALQTLADSLLGLPSNTILLSGIVAGWLMGLLAWLIAAGRDTTSQIIFIWLVTLVIGIGHLHHSITGALDVMAALFAGADVTIGALIHVLVLATVANAIGGGVLAVLVRYSLVIEEGKPGRTSDAGTGRARR